MQTIPVNYWAVLVCGAVSLVLGSIWYGPLFGKMWIHEMGWDKVDPSKQEEMKKEMYKSYALSFIGSLVMAYVLSHSLVYASTYTSVVGVSAGLMVGFWNWLGFIAPVTLGNVLWGNQSWKLWFVGNGYQLVQLLIFGVILAIWK